MSAGIALELLSSRERFREQLQPLAPAPWAIGRNGDIVDAGARPVLGVYCWDGLAPDQVYALQLLIVTAVNTRAGLPAIVERELA